MDEPIGVRAEDDCPIASFPDDPIKHMDDGSGKCGYCKKAMIVLTDREKNPNPSNPDQPGVVPNPERGGNDYYSDDGTSVDPFIRRYRCPGCHRLVWLSIHRCVA